MPKMPMNPTPSSTAALQELKESIATAVPDCVRDITYKWHPIRAAIQKLSETQSLGNMTLRDIAAAIGQPKASPQKIKHHIEMLYRIEHCKPRVYRPIRLADVIIAARRTAKDAKEAMHLDSQLCIYWRMNMDSLDLQSPATLSFLHQLLCPTK